MAAATGISVGVAIAAVLAEEEGTVLLKLTVFDCFHSVGSCFSSELRHKPSNYKVKPEVTGISPGSTVLFL